MFKLTPNWGQGTWTKSILYSFRAANDGRNPISTLIADAQGALYGATNHSENCDQAGTIFKLTPPAGAQGAWTEQVVHDFCQDPDSYGGDYASGLSIDGHGVLYGTEMPVFQKSYVPGAVFRLTPPGDGQSAWTKTIIYDFPDADALSVGAAPFGRLVIDRQGALYGTASSGAFDRFGTVFKLTPPAPGQTNWTATALHQFAGGSDGASPYGGLVADRAGALYGTTERGGIACPFSFGSGCGTVFKLTPLAAGQNSWTHTVLYSFQGGSDGGFPTSAPRLDWRGAVYGNTETTIFKLKPPNPGTAAWTETTYYSSTLGIGPVLVADWGSRLFAPVEFAGAGCPNSYYGTQGCGTILEVPLTSHGFGLRAVGALQP